MVSLTETVLETVTDDDDDVVVVVRVKEEEEESSLLDDLTGLALPKPGRYKHRALHLNPSSNVLLLLMLLFDSVLTKKEFRRESLLLVDPQDLLLFNEADEDESCSLPSSARIRPERCLGEFVVEFGRLRLTNLVRTGCKGRGIGASKSLGGDMAGNSIISKLSFLLKDGDIDKDLTTDLGSIDISLSECLILVCLTRIFFFGSSLPRTCQSS